jgi:WhiB family redox-sensing transcriptional regulator
MLEKVHCCQARAAALEHAGPGSMTDRGGIDRLVEALGLLNDSHRWMANAACRGLDPDLFFPRRGDSSAEAKKICSGCAVRAECAALAAEHHERHGIWGGMSERDRKRARRRRRQLAA